MKGSDKAVVLGLLMAVVLVGFYLKVLSPKREEASSLKTEITELQSQVDQERQVAAFGEQARAEFPRFYSRLVVLGKAVPDQADTASLMVQLNSIANRTDVKFMGIEVGAVDAASSSSSSTPTPSTTSGSSSTPTTGSSSTSTTSSATESSSASSSSTAGTSSTATPAPATEAGAASLPIGATVGPAGLPTLPYDLTFAGSYFQVASFLSGVDELVRVRGNSQLDPNGRLLTISGFSLEPLTGGPSPELEVRVAVTSYATPSTEGLTLGASPTAPAPSPSQPQTQPASATVAQ